MYKKYRIPFPLVDIYFIVWRPKAISKIHNHSKSGCYLFLLKGNIKEEIYSKKLTLINMNYYSTFDLSYINDKIGFHRIINSDNYSYSLHIYHPKNHKTIYFN
tara:strand:+ start:3840 stop:4148 length:309 start_codon:yes stop_codon:yes gene_type:complete